MHIDLSAECDDWTIVDRPVEELRDRYNIPPL